jgi:hypothetical protein
VRPNPLTGVSLAGVNEHPGGIGMALGCFAKQRTLC